MIEAGKLIYDLVKAITGVTITGIYPQIAPEKTNLNYIVYQVENDYLTTKDGIVGNTAVITLNLYTKDYATGVSISKTIFEHLNNNSIIDSSDYKARLSTTVDNPSFSGDYFETNLNVIVRLYS